MAVPQQVSRDGEHPTPLVTHRAAVLEGAHDPEEDLLTQVVRDVRPTGHADQVTVDVPLVSAENVRGRR
jgi:hypothetical protein